jgi:hypothetical protein
MRKLAIVLVAGALVTATGSASAQALTPSEGQLLENGEAVTAPCSVNGNAVDDEAKSWIVYTYDPKRIWAAAKTELAPAKLPQFEEIKYDVSTVSGASLQGQAEAEPGGSTCVVKALTEDSTASGPEVTLSRPGPYALEQIDSKVHWVALGEGETEPTPEACAENNKDYPSPEVGLNPPPDPEVRWAVSTYCNVVTVTHFEVAAGPGGCPKSGDGSQFPADPYINQYQAGALDGLPLSFNVAGGNACGPSSLLMALAHALPASLLPTLNHVFDETMTLPAARVKPNGGNVFEGEARAAAYLQSIGFKQAKIVYLQNDFYARLGGNEIQIDDGLASGPIVISTDFGTSRWGLAGGGHMVLVEGRPSPGMYTVDDPAGDFFSRSKGHYNPSGECGYQILYPEAWLMAATTGRWFLELGPYTGPLPAGGALVQPGFAHTMTGGLSTPLTAAGAPELSAFAVFDAHPGTAEDPATFYLEDPEGRRTGFIEGATVSEIPYSSVGQASPGFTDPRKGDEEFDPEPESEPPAAPRSIALASPQAGITLHVSAASGSAYALTAEAWLDGARSAGDQLAGVGSGGDTVIDSPALDTLIAPSGEPSEPPPGGGSQAGGGGAQTTAAQGSPSSAGTLATATAAGGGTLRAGPVAISKRRARVTVSCAGGRCTGAVTLTVRGKRSTLIVQRATIALGAGGRRTIQLKPTAVGARLLRGRRRLRATLTITQTVAPGRRRVVLRRGLTI